jgi:hypothetical protein
MTRTMHRLRYCLIGAAVAALALATTALGGSGVGGVFNLGEVNSVDGTTALTGTTAGSQLQVTNASTAASVFSIYGLIDSTAPGGGSTAVRGHNKGTGIAGYGVYGSHAGEGIGVYGTAATGAGAGVIGRHLGSTGSGPGVKGVTSSPTGAAVLGLNLGGGPGLSSTVNSGVAPLSVNSDTKVAKLNADKLDGLDSTGFLQNQVPLTLSGYGPTDTGIINGNGYGTANGVQGTALAGGASGVYGADMQGGFGVSGHSTAPAWFDYGAGVFGENTGGGRAVWGRSNSPGGIGVYAEATGGGPALKIQNDGSAPPMAVNSAGKVDNLNADKVDGASIVSNRIISTTGGDHILQVPGFGDFNVMTCDHANARFIWDSGGPLAYVTWRDDFNNDNLVTVNNQVVSLSKPRHFVTVQLARDTGASTSIATVTVTTNASDCVFAAQAVVQPG